MGMEGKDVALLLSQLGVSGINAWAAPDGQELQSFEGHGPLDPRNMYSEARSQTNDMIEQLKARANRPVTVRSAYVQQPPVFTGGGLPMPIGVSGMDAALADRSLLSLPGLSGASVDPIPKGDVFDPRQPPDDSNPDPNAPPENGPMSRMSTTAGPARRTLPGQSLFDAPNVSGHDDLGQAAGAMEVYLRSLAGG